MSDSDDERTVHWYYVANGKEMGPVLVARLRQMARQGLLKPNDLVRKGKTGEWDYAGRFDELASHAEEFAAEQAADEESEEAEEPPEPQSRGPSLRERVSDLISDVARSVAERLELVRTIAGCIALAVTLFLLVRVTLNAEIFDWSTPADPLVVYQSLWDELQTHRQARADDATWKAFAERGRQEVAPLVARLEREAGSTNREAQLLLWAGRDCLPKMFDDAHTAPSRAEEQLAEYLENVQRLRQGQVIYGGNLGGYRPPPRIVTVSRWFGGDPVTAALAIALTIGNLGLAAWLLRGLLRKRESSNSNMTT